MISVNADKGEFSFFIIPDTQVMTEWHAPLFGKMADWVVAHAQSLHVKMILHLGDVVDDGMLDMKQVDIASAGLDKIDQADIPMLIAPGNHDYDTMLDHNRSLSVFNQYFGLRRYRDKAWFGGVFEEGRAENCYATLTINGVPYLFLALEFGPRDEVLAWVDGVLTKHRDHNAIIITHCYMFIDGTRNKPGDAHNPKLYKGAAGANDGEDMWNKCFRKHGNIRAIYSGHQVPVSISYRTDLGDHGNPVFQSFQNWQDADHGGAGRMRIAVYRPTEGRVDHYVVNPHTGALEEGKGYEVSYRLHATPEQAEEELLTRFP